MTDERRIKRKEIRHLQSESVWLQKAVFALRKAEAAHEQVADIRDEKVDAYHLSVGGKETPIEEIEDALDERIETLVKNVREMRRNLG